VLKKAMELSLLCEAKVLLIIYDDFEKKSIFYSSEEDYKTFANDYFEKKISADNFLNSDYNTNFFKETETTKSDSGKSKDKSPEGTRKDSFPEVDSEKSFTEEAKKVTENLTESKAKFDDATKVNHHKLLNTKRNSVNIFSQQNSFPTISDNFFTPWGNQLTTPLPMPQNIFNNFPSQNSNFTSRTPVVDLNKMLMQNYMNMYMLSKHN